MATVTDDDIRNYVVVPALRAAIHTYTDAPDYDEDAIVDELLELSRDEWFWKDGLTLTHVRLEEDDGTELFWDIVRRHRAEAHVVCYPCNACDTATGWIIPVGKAMSETERGVDTAGEPLDSITFYIHHKPKQWLANFDAALAGKGWRSISAMDVDDDDIARAALVRVQSAPCKWCETTTRPTEQVYGAWLCRRCERVWGTAFAAYHALDVSTDDLKRLLACAERSDGESADELRAIVGVIPYYDMLKAAQKLIGYRINRDASKSRSAPTFPSGLPGTKR